VKNLQYMTLSRTLRISKIDFAHGKEYHKPFKNRKYMTDALQIRRGLEHRFVIGFNARDRFRPRGVPGEEVREM
jgi:hypothetical protein